MNLGELFYTIRVKLGSFKKDIQEAQKQAVDSSKKINSQFEKLADGIKKANEAINRFGDSAKKVGKSMSDTGKRMSMGMTLPIVAAGTAAFKMQKDFESAMSKIIGLVGVASDQVEQWSKDILKMAPRLGKAPSELADALFFVTSAGIKGAAAMDVLEKSAKASAAGLGETKVVADLVTSAMNAYGQANLSAGQATDILVAAVREGKAEAPELSAALGGVLPIASEMKVQFNEVGAAIAAMTRTGTNAATASTQLKGIMAAFLKPTNDAEDALTMMGTSSEEFRRILSEDGLIAALVKLKGLQEEYGETTISQVVPNIRAMMGVFDLVGANMEDNIGIFERMTNTTGALDHAFATTAETADFKWKQALASGQVALVQVGATVADFVVPILQKLAGWLNSVSEWWSELGEGTRKTIIQVLAITAAIGPLLVIGGKLVTVIGVASKAFAALNAIMIANPIGLIVVGIAAVIAYIAIAVKHWDKFGAAMLLLMGPVGLFIGMIKSLYDNWQSVVDAFRGGGILEGMKRIGQVILSALLTPIEQLLNLIGKIPGMKFADNWSESIKKFKKEVLGIETKPLEKAEEVVDELDEGIQSLTSTIKLNTSAVDDSNVAHSRSLGIYEELNAEIQKYNDLEAAATTIAQAVEMRKLADAARQALENHESLVAALSQQPKKMQPIGIPPERPASLSKKTVSGTPKKDEGPESIKADGVWDFASALSAINEQHRLIKESMEEGIDTTNLEVGLNTLIEKLHEVTSLSNILKNAFAEFGMAVMDAGINATGSIKDFGKTTLEIIRKTIAGLIAEGVAGAVAKALVSAPFPFNIGLAGMAGGLAAAAFNSIIPKFAHGGIVPPGYPNDTYPAFLTSGETVIPPKALPQMGGGELTHRISGQDLLIILNEAQRRNTGNY